MTSARPEFEALRRAVNAIPKDELVSICEEEIAEPEAGEDPWRDRLKRDLVDRLITALPQARVRELAADGSARVRTPGLLGFIWHLRDYDEDPAAISSALRRITDTDLTGVLQQPRVVDLGDSTRENDRQSVLVELRYVTESWQVTPDGETHRLEQRRTANIAIDILTGVLTVFASPAEAAGVIAEGVAGLLDARITPLTLNQVAVPNVDGAAFAPSALQVLEIVYGRFAEQYDILHAPNIWIRPVAEGAVAEERASRGEGADMFGDDVVRADLRSGAEIRGIRFYLREQPPAGDPRASVATLAATVKADDELGISLRLARGSYSTDRVMTIYEELRSMMMRAEPSSGIALAAKLQTIA